MRILDFAHLAGSRLSALGNILFGEVVLPAILIPKCGASNIFIQELPSRAFWAARAFEAGIAESGMSVEEGSGSPADLAVAKDGFFMQLTEGDLRQNCDALLTRCNELDSQKDDKVQLDSGAEYRCELAYL